ncbi:MAG: hypothetical protein HYR76_10735 [Ignavibacteria bacterium]|nr:hypothetical protein [Ignavibacteria bacterium]
MTWVCPNCKRNFKHKNQSHSCVRVDPEDHFLNKSPNVERVYKMLLAEVRKFGKVNVSPVKNCILLKTSSTFLALKPKKRWMDIEFLLDEEVNDYPIHKTVQASKRRFAHFVRLEDTEEIDKRLLSLLRRSYTLMKSS